MAAVLTSARAGRTAGTSGLNSGRGCRHFAPFDCHWGRGQFNCEVLPSEGLLLWRLCCSIATSQRLR